MKTIFFKSGGYYETPAVSVASAIYESLGDSINQFNKSDMSFKFDVVDNEHRLFLANHVSNNTTIYRSFDPQKLIDGIDKYGFAYYGYVCPVNAVVTHAEVFNKMTYVAFDAKGKNFIDLITGMKLAGNNIIPVIYGLKISKNIYAGFLSAMATIDGHLVDEKDEHRIIGDVIAVYSNDGQSIRDRFIGLSFKNVVKHFHNADLVAGYAVYANCGQVIELDVFKNNRFTTEEFKNSFELIVESNFKYEIKDKRILLTTPKTPQQGYLSVSLRVAPLYRDASVREIKETLEFDFMVNVI